MSKTKRSIEEYETPEPVRNWLLRATLQVAVPMWIEKLKARSLAEIQERSHSVLADVIASRGDVLQFASKKTRRQTAEAFNALAEGLAGLGFCPGGVRFAGDHYIAEHPERAP
jgi:hypothetical protein